MFTLTASVGRTGVSRIQPMFKEIISGFNCVIPILGVRPHELIIHWFQYEGGLFDESSFRGDKPLINHIRVPAF
jgi:hypothetical protein